MAAWHGSSNYWRIAGVGRALNAPWVMWKVVALQCNHESFEVLRHVTTEAPIYIYQGIFIQRELNPG